MTTDNHQEPLSEGPFDSLLTKTKGMGSRIANNVLRKMGSTSAEGRHDVRITTDKLVGGFKKWLAYGQGRQATLDNLMSYIGRFGQQYPALVQSTFSGRQVAAQPNGQAGAQPGAPRLEPTMTGTAPAAAPGTAPATTPGTEADAAYADPAKRARIDKVWADRQTRQQNVRKVPQTRNPYPSGAVRADTAFNASKQDRSQQGYQNATMSQIVKTIRAPNPDVRTIAGLTKELISHARDYGGNEKDRVTTFLRQMQKNPAVAKNPKLQAMMRGMRVESVHRAISAALYLVEHEVRTKRAINEAVRYFALSEDTMLKASDVDRLLGVVAQDMLDNGQATTHEAPRGAQRQGSENWLGQRSQPAMSSQPATSSRVEPTMTSAAPAPAINLGKLGAALDHQGVDPANKKWVMDAMGKPGASAQTVYAAYKKANGAVPDNVAHAFMSMQTS